MLKGAVSFGIFCLSPFVILGFLDLGIGFGRSPSSGPFGQLDAATARPLRVTLRLDSSPFADLGVGGEKGAWSFCYSLVMPLFTWPEMRLPICHHMSRCDDILSAVRIRPRS